MSDPVAVCMVELETWLFVDAESRGGAFSEKLEASCLWRTYWVPNRLRLDRVSNIGLNLCRPVYHERNLAHMVGSLRAVRITFFQYVSMRMNIRV